MSTVTEILRLRYGPLAVDTPPSTREIARIVGVSHPTVTTYLRRAEAAGLATWPLSADFSEADIDAMLTPPNSGVARRTTPDWAVVHAALTDPARQKTATLITQWEQYRAQSPEGYGLTQFRLHYARWAKRQTAVMRFAHAPGERVYVDFAGTTMEVVDRTTGDVRRAQIFVAVQGYSQYTFAYAVWTQQLPDWIDCHNQMLGFFGGVPRGITPDNLKAAVVKAHRYDPELNPTYWEWAMHNDVIVFPARARRPRDKALAELAVKLVGQRVLDACHGRTFHSLAELNAAIRERLALFNARPFQKREGSRLALFTTHDRPALKALPALPYEYAEYKEATVGPDYHVLVHAHYYSVPYTLIGQKVRVRVTQRTLEVLHGHERVAAHLRSTKRYGFTTNAAHRPERHTQHLRWTPERLTHWAEKIGPAVAALVGRILHQKYALPEQGIRSCLGLLSLEKAYPSARLNAACARAVRYDLLSSRSVRSILEQGLDAAAVSPTTAVTETTPPHPNVRGATYFA
jgi:transposase